MFLTPSGIMGENTLGEWSDGDDDWIWEIDESTFMDWSDPEADDIIRNIDENTSGDWSDPEADDIIRNIDENTSCDWTDPEADDIIRNIDENTSCEWSDPEADDIIRNINVQTGGGKKRKSDEVPEPEQDFYEIETTKKYNSKKFQMTATDHTVRFNNTLDDLDLLESYERVQRIFGHLLNDVTRDMNERDKVRFVLRSDQLNTPISIPFMLVPQLTPERVFSQIERVVQSNRDFRLNDTVIVDILHVEAPQGSGRSKRTTLNIREYLHEKRSIVTIKNNDNLCLARALVVAVAKAENAPNYRLLTRSDRSNQEKEAKKLHAAANVPLGPCGIPEVKLFQKYLTNYEINIVSGNQNNAIIYPPKTGNNNNNNNVTPIYLYLHDNHYDVITSMPGFLSRSYFCHTCKKVYSNKFAHLCKEMCKLCRGYDCVKGNGDRVCNECERWFKSKACYDRHKEPVGGARSVCEGVRKCKKCGKVMEVRNLTPKGHICGRKCPTCKVILNEEDEHKCYIQKTEQPEESHYSELLFFYFECTQEHGIHEANLCIVHDEKGREKLFEGNDTAKKFCEWLLTKEHPDCIVVAHNFQGYDGYFIQNYLNKNAIKYEIVLRGAKILSMTVPMFNIKVIDSLNFIPMALSQFPKTFGKTELCKGYFPHFFNKEENQNYIGSIPDVDYYSPKTMKPEAMSFGCCHTTRVLYGISRNAPG